MKKRILSLIICAVMGISMCACSDIENNENDKTLSPDNSVTVTEDQNTPVVTDGNTASPDSQPTVTEDNKTENNTSTKPKPDADWKYEFDSAFIEQNGIAHVWEQLDEDTKINLGEVMNAINDVMLYCPLSIGVPKDQADSFLDLVINCSMFYTWRGTKFKVHADESGMVKGLTLDYRVDYEDDAVERAESLEKRLKEIVDKMPSGTDFEKIKYLHDELILSCDYSDDAASPFTAYGALVEGKATCQGYSDAMLLLLDRAGYEVAFATGEGKDTSVKHKWVYVKCSDGKWYVIDPTWDDPQNITDVNYVGYDYLFISDEELLKDHAKKYESSYYKTPVADSMDLNYHKVMGYYTNDADEAYDIIKKQAIEAVKDGRRYIYLRADDGDTINKIYKAVAGGSLGNNKLESILIEASKETKDKIKTAKWQKSINEKTGTLVITILDEE